LSILKVKGVKRMTDHMGSLLLLVLYGVMALGGLLAARVGR
jgi:hypothetical protein